MTLATLYLGGILGAASLLLPLVRAIGGYATMGALVLAVLWPVVAVMGLVYAVWDVWRERERRAA